MIRLMFVAVLMLACTASAGPLDRRELIGQLETEWNRIYHTSMLQCYEEIQDAKLCVNVVNTQFQSTLNILKIPSQDVTKEQTAYVLTVCSFAADDVKAFRKCVVNQSAQRSEQEWSDLE